MEDDPLLVIYWFGAGRCVSEVVIRLEKHDRLNAPTIGPFYRPYQCFF